MAVPADIRRTIAKHLTALEAFGLVRSAREPYTSGKGRVAYATAHRLNEEQATYVTMHCRTERAEAVKVQLVKVFTAWRRGQLVPSQPTLPNFADPIEAAKAFIQAEEGRPASGGPS